VTGGAAPYLTVVIPGDLSTRTGGYGYDRRIIEGLRHRGWQVDVRLLDDSFPFPSAAARRQAVQVLGAVPDGGTVLVDGLAFGVLPDEVGHERARLDIVALVHHPLAAETGLDARAAATLEDSERRALVHARAVIVTSRATADALRRYDVAPERVVVAAPGTDPAPLARSSRDRAGNAAPCRLLCVATLTPRKGHDLLFRALASLGDRPWHLVCAGSFDRDLATAARLREQMQALRIGDRVDLLGDLNTDALAIQYDLADVFVLPTLYEGYGMAVAEALARGLPVVSTATGGIAELVGDAAGIVVAPGDLEAFTAALSRVLDDADLRERLADGARLARNRLSTWDETVRTIEGVVARRAHKGSAGGFSAEWLSLREPADAAARSTRLTGTVADVLRSRAGLRVLDLGAGRGANLRYLAPRLPAPQEWLLVDRDAVLLQRVHSAGAPCHFTTLQRDLTSLGSSRDLFADRSLVTASALLDLVSEDWLQELVDRCGAAGSVVLFVLSYDGRIECTPDDAGDAMIRALVNDHQRTDKGFGPALGPGAAAAVVRHLSSAGYNVEQDRSDWVLSPAMHVLQRQLIEGWADAAAAVRPERAPAIDAWRIRRVSQASAGRLEIVVGHQDVAGWLPAVR